MADTDKAIGDLTTGPASGRRVLGAILLAVVIGAAAAALWPAMNGAFLNWDDDRNFVENSSFRGIGPSQWAWAWKTYHLGVWQPLAWLLFGVEWCWAGLAPRTYHLVSLALHLLNCALLYGIIVRLLGLGAGSPQARDGSWSRIYAAVATLLFAVHPLRVETVAWVSAQPYLPAVFFYLLAILAYLRAHACGQARRAWLLVVILCYAVAVLFKAVAVTLPPVLLILDYYALGRRGWRAWAEKAPLILIALPVCLWAAAAKDFNASRAPFHEFDLNARLAHAAYGLTFYLTKTFVPRNLSPYYSLPKDISLASGRFAIAAIAVAAVSIFAVTKRRKWPAFLAAWMAYLVILLPNLGLIQIGQQLATDRYSYLAIMPFTALFAGLLWAAHRRPALRKAGVPLALVFLALLAASGLTWATRAQSRIWLNSRAVWLRALDVEPNCAVAHCNLGAALLREGNYTDASFYLSRAIDLDDRFAFAYSNFAVLLCNIGRFDDAVIAAREALAGQPALQDLDLARVHAVLGQAYAGLHQNELAMEQTLKARELGFVEADKMIEYLRKYRGMSPSSQPASPLRN